MISPRSPACESAIFLASPDPSRDVCRFRCSKAAWRARVLLSWLTINPLVVFRAVNLPKWVRIGGGEGRRREGMRVAGEEALTGDLDKWKAKGGAGSAVEHDVGDFRSRLSTRGEIKKDRGGKKSGKRGGRKRGRVQDDESSATTHRGVDQQDHGSDNVGAGHEGGEGTSWSRGGAGDDRADRIEGAQESEAGDDGTVVKQGEVTVSGGAFGRGGGEMRSCMEASVCGGSFGANEGAQHEGSDKGTDATSGGGGGDAKVGITGSALDGGGMLNERGNGEEWGMGKDQEKDGEGRYSARGAMNAAAHCDDGDGNGQISQEKHRQGETADSGRGGADDSDQDVNGDRRDPSAGGVGSGEYVLDVKNAWSDDDDDDDGSDRGFATGFKLRGENDVLRLRSDPGSNACSREKPGRGPEEPPSSTWWNLSQLCVLCVVMGGQQTCVLFPITAMTLSPYCAESAGSGFGIPLLGGVCVYKWTSVSIFGGFLLSLGAPLVSSACSSWSNGIKRQKEQGGRQNCFMAYLAEARNPTPKPPTCKEILPLPLTQDLQ